ncbi:MAG: MarC family transcriptional regulator [Crocinitomicaceae bacterium]|nr:MarC family transcriptional regulator [Crocinitomicaceae bacterium]
MEDLVSTFIFFFAVIDPIGTVPVFIAATTGFEDVEKRKVALKAVLVAALVLVFFIFTGEIILDAIEIPLSAFQIAGGIVLFLFALTMIFGESKPDEEIKMVKNVNETAIFPIAIPSIASPGAMLTAVMITKNSDHSLFEQFESTLVMFGVLSITLILILLASKIHRVIGNSGASVISKVMGLILSALAVSNVLAGFKDYFDL